ncbi:hypothetical protein MMC34_001066 [Xylographa carneopallida]|nr:hypothetical protein [Xylographa carneopallida]
MVPSLTSSPIANPPMSSGVAMPSAMANPAISPAPTIQSIPTGAIAGGCVGGVAAVALLALIYFWCRRRTAESRKRISTATGTSSMFGFKAAEAKIPPGMDTFLETKDSPYTDSSPISPTPSHQPFVGFPMDEKLGSMSFQEESGMKLSHSQRSYELPSRSSTMTGNQLLQSSPERQNHALGISDLPINSQPPLSANPFTHPQYRLNIEQDRTAFRAELDATENVSTSTKHGKSFDRQRRRQKVQQNDYWPPGGRL